MRGTERACQGFAAISVGVVWRITFKNLRIDAVGRSFTRENRCAMVRVRRKLISQYGLALVFVGLALVLSNFLWPFTDRASATLFLAAIMLSAFFGGLGPGLIATAISAFFIDYYFVPPFYRFELSSSTFLRAGMFTVLSVLVSWLNGSRRRLMLNLRERDQERERLLEQINLFNVHLKQEVDQKTQDLNAAACELLSAQQHLARAEKMELVGQLTASLAHEIGTPLNAISGHLQLLSRNHPSHIDTQRRVRIINKQLDFIVSIVKSLLERSHKRQAVIKPLDLSRVLKEMFVLVSPMLEQRSVNFELALPWELPLIAADQDKLQQVFLNLINNSLDAMPSGGQLSISTSYLPNDASVSITFSDSGQGIDPELFDKIFEPMWTDKSAGNGFGLAIVRDIVREHGGEIEPVSVNGPGACFRFTLPVFSQLPATIENEVFVGAD
ncbi:MAG: two-component system, NtrC family, sensor kinase [Blastocatellia bacterium]|jgi:signal transduction histidine kinase|nr:two-component system, NtrC family, sensor kinase [Blastocatellia bacterium]